MSPVWGVAILVLSVWFLLAVLSSAIALRKNRSVTRWYLLTLLFGIVPFLRHPLPATPPSGSLPASPTHANLGPISVVNPRLLHRISASLDALCDCLLRHGLTTICDRRITHSA